MISNLGFGTYILLVTDSVGCSSLDTIFVPLATSIEELSNEDGIKVFPNPASDVLTVQLLEDKRNDELISAMLINALGQSVLFHTNRTDDTIEFDVSELEAGFYTLHLVHSEKGVITRKVLIE